MEIISAEGLNGVRGFAIVLFVHRVSLSERPLAGHLVLLFAIKRGAAWLGSTS
jgi:hypothetical protein